MEINLSQEMIEKITCVAFGRVQDLKQKEEESHERIAVGERQIARKHLLINDFQRARADEEEVHELFLSMLEELQKIHLPMLL